MYIWIHLPTMRLGFSLPGVHSTQLLKLVWGMVPDGQRHAAAAICNGHHAVLAAVTLLSATPETFFWRLRLFQGAFNQRIRRFIKSLPLRSPDCQSPSWSGLVDTGHTPLQMTCFVVECPTSEGLAEEGKWHQSWHIVELKTCCFHHILYFKILLHFMWFPDFLPFDHMSLLTLAP